MNTTAQEHRIKCGHCHRSHSTPEEVHFCAFGVFRTQFAAVSQPAQEAAATVAQSRLLPPPPKESIRMETKVPLDLLLNLKDGYYAARLDDTTPFKFFRVSRPKSGRYKDTIKVQTQHGPRLEVMLVVWPDSRVSLYDSRGQDELIVVCIDQLGTGMNYAEELKRCSRCTAELTDARSRWYGIGPECEKHRPEQISLVDDIKGAYVPGA